MNILLTCDDGPASYGLALLRQKVKQRFKEAKVFTIISEGGEMARSMSLNHMSFPTIGEYPLEEVERNFFVLKDGSPLDCVLLAQGFPQRFLSAGQFDTIISGVNMGANVGLDLFTSGTIAPVAFASMAFGWAGLALSQAYPNKEENTAIVTEGGEKGYYKNADAALIEVLMSYSPDPGECINVNFPDNTHTLKGISTTPVANYSRWFSTHDLPIGMDCDVRRLSEGFITISEIELRCNPHMRF